MNESVIVLETCDSTNRVAKELAKEGAPHGTCVLAIEQTAGRGRLGRTFFSPKGDGLYMSFVLRPEAEPDVQLLTCFAATAVTRALEPFALEAWGRKPEIKWVNDILIRRKKVSGILAERVSAETGEKPGAEAPREGTGLPRGAIILGIGVNLFNERKFPPEIAETAAVLFPESYLEKDPEREGKTLSEEALEARKSALRDRVADAICTEVRGWDGGAFDPGMIEEYRSKSLLLGRSIDFELNGEKYYGVVTSVLDNGNLMVVLPQGKHVLLNSGEVTLHNRSFLQQ